MINIFNTYIYTEKCIQKYFFYKKIKILYKKILYNINI